MIREGGWGGWGEVHCNSLSIESHLAQVKAWNGVGAETDVLRRYSVLGTSYMLHSNQFTLAGVANRLYSLDSLHGPAHCTRRLNSRAKHWMDFGYA